jgi:CMP/dCMP kinase|tara:strand:+ start:493 stop:1182 length:690 start_codon:yes stop_codon:yes gene_type:complete
LKSKKIDKKRLCLAFDGFSASGKSLGAKLISKKYKLKLLNSGLLYRYAAFLILKNKPNKKISFLKKKFSTLNYKYLTFSNLHSEKISNYSSIIAKQKKIRLILAEYQKKFARKFKRIAIEGRDISTKILNKNPRYDVAFFFKCKLSTAAYRRWKDLKTSKEQISLAEVKKSLQKRNELDVKRRFSPLIRSKDSIIIRTDILNKKEMVAKMSKEIEKKLLLKYGRNFETK